MLACLGSLTKVRWFTGIIRVDGENTACVDRLRASFRKLFTALEYSSAGNVLQYLEWHGPVNETEKRVYFFFLSKVVSIR